jgi:antigen flippase
MIGTSKTPIPENPDEESTATSNVAILLTVCTRGLQIAAGVAASIVTARFLAPAGRGEYFVVITLARTLAQFGTLGQQSSNTYFVARDRRLFASLVANSFWIAVVICGGGSVVLLAVMYSGQSAWGTPSAALWFAAILAPVSLFYMLGTNLLVGIRQFKLFNAFELMSAALVLAAVMLAGVMGAGPTGFVAASVAAWGLVAAALFVTLRRHGAGTWRFQPDVFRSSVRYSTKAYLATLAGFLLLRSNVFILNGLRGVEQVGYYSVATQVADVLAVLPQSAALVLFPNLVRDGLGGFGRMIRNMTAVGALLATGCVAVAFLADPMIRIAFGPQFLPAGPVLRLLLPGVLFAGMTAIASQYLSAIGFPRAQVAIWFGGFGLATILSWLLIPRFGAGGAALALSITKLMVLVLILRLAWTTHRQRAD